MPCLNSSWVLPCIVMMDPWSSRIMSLLHKESVPFLGVTSRYLYNLGLSVSYRETKQTEALSIIPLWQSSEQRCSHFDPGTSWRRPGCSSRLSFGWLHRRAQTPQGDHRCCAQCCSPSTCTSLSSYARDRSEFSSSTSNT